MQTRRNFINSLAVGAAMFTVRGLYAQALTETASMTEGPFYPDKLPLDTDNDLLIINDSITPAVGEVTHLTGTLRNTSGEPIRNAFIEIWQVDAKASYLHSAGRGPNGPDGNFQGYGRFLTDSHGEYYFRTIKPVPYSLGGTFRAPHIHFAISQNGRRIFTTQVHIRGHEANTRDNLLNAMRDSRLRESVLADFSPIPDSRIGELSARFDIVMGRTGQDSVDSIRGGISRPERFRRGR